MIISSLYFTINTSDFQVVPPLGMSEWAIAFHHLQATQLISFTYWKWCYTEIYELKWSANIRFYELQVANRSLQFNLTGLGSSDNNKAKFLPCYRDKLKTLGENKSAGMVFILQLLDLYRRRCSNLWGRLCCSPSVEFSKDRLFKAFDKPYP